MCQYISGLIHPTDLSDIRVGDPLSHSGGRKQLGLATDWGLEWEWTCDDAGESLTVRVAPDHDARDADGEPIGVSSYVAAILARWPTRAGLELCLMSDADAGVRWRVANRIAAESKAPYKNEKDKQ